MLRCVRALPLLTALTLLLTLPALTGCGSQAQTTLKVQEALSETLRTAQLGSDPKHFDDKQARVWADRAVAAAPQDPAVYFGPTAAAAASPLPQLSLALVFSAVGDDPALADYMTQAVQKFPGDYRGYQFLIEALGRLGRTAERKSAALKAIALLTKQIQAPGAQNIPVLTETLGYAYFAAGDPVNGAAQYKKVIQAYPALSSYPGDLGPYNGLAYGYAEANVNIPEALGIAQQAIALAKKSGMGDEQLAPIQDTLGWVQYRQGDYADAEQNLLQAANSDPRQSEIRYHLGMVYIAQGKTDAARAELGHAVLLSQGFAAAQQALDTLPKQTTASL